MKTIKEIYESLILEAMSLEDIWEKYYKQDIKLFPAFENINKMDPTAGSNKKGKYLDWLIKKAYKNNPKIVEDSSKIKEDLELFDKNYKHINKQITQIKDQYELSKLVEEFRKKKDSGEIAISRSEIKKGAEKLFENSDWIIVHPKTEEAAKFYGANTRWCTAADEDNMFDFYNKQSPLYILINKKENQKFQFHFKSRQYMDEKDNPIDDTQFWHIFKSIGDELLELAEKDNSIYTFLRKLKDVEIPIDAYAKKYAASISKYEKEQGLFNAVAEFAFTTVKELIDSGIKVTITTEYGDTLLDNLLQYRVPRESNSAKNQIKICDYILSKTHDINFFANAFAIAIINYMPSIIEVFLKYKFDINKKIDEYPLFLIYHNPFDYDKKAELVKFLVEKGADVNITNNDNLSFLDILIDKTQYKLINDIFDKFKNIDKTQFIKIILLSSWTTSNDETLKQLNVLAKNIFKKINITDDDIYKIVSSKVYRDDLVALNFLYNQNIFKHNTPDDKIIKFIQTCISELNRRTLKFILSKFKIDVNKYAQHIVSLIITYKPTDSIVEDLLEYIKDNFKGTFKLDDRNATWFETPNGKNTYTRRIFQEYGFLDK